MRNGIFFPLKLLLNEMQSCFWLEWSIAMGLVGLWGWAGHLLFEKIDWLLSISLCLCLSVSLFLCLTLSVSLCISLFVSLYLSVSLSLLPDMSRSLSGTVWRKTETHPVLFTNLRCVFRFGVMKDRVPVFWKLGFQSQLHLWFPNCQSPPTPLGLHFPRCEMGAGWAGTHTHCSGTTTAIPHVVSRKDSGLTFEIYFFSFF